MSSDQSYAQLRGLGLQTPVSVLACPVGSFIQCGLLYLRLRRISGKIILWDPEGLLEEESLESLALE